MARRSREDSRRTDARSYVWAVLLSCLLAALEMQSGELRD